MPEEMSRQCRVPLCRGRLMNRCPAVLISPGRESLQPEARHPPNVARERKRDKRGASLLACVSAVVPPGAGILSVIHSSQRIENVRLGESADDEHQWGAGPKEVLRRPMLLRARLTRWTRAGAIFSSPSSRTRSLFCWLFFLRRTWWRRPCSEPICSEGVKGDILYHKV